MFYLKNEQKRNLRNKSMVLFFLQFPHTCACTQINQRKNNFGIYTELLFFRYHKIISTVLMQCININL